MVPRATPGIGALRRLTAPKAGVQGVPKGVRSRLKPKAVTAVARPGKMGIQGACFTAASTPREMTNIVAMTVAPMAISTGGKWPRRFFRKRSYPGVNLAGVDLDLGIDPNG